MTTTLAPAAPPLPAAREVVLPGRGTTHVLESTGPPGAPTAILLHGLGASAALNWFAAFPALESRMHVVAPDHRGHGRGVRDPKPFTLEDAADDVVAVADATGIDRFVAVGYSMGGPIAELVWRRHRERVAGLVLCATSCRFRITPQEHALFASIGALARVSRVAPGTFSASFVSRVSTPFLAGCAYGDWARSELLRRDSRAVIEAAAALGTYSGRASLHAIDVPTAVLVHRRDQVVPPPRQHALATLIRGATRHEVDADHFAPVREPDRFAAALVAGVDAVTSQSHGEQQLRAAS